MTKKPGPIKRDVELAKSIGANLRRLRLARGHSQRTLAIALQCTRTCVAWMELGHTSVSIQRVIELACVFDVEAAELFQELLKETDDDDSTG